MDKIKKGDIVGRLSYGKDILFKVDKVIKKSNGEKLVILKGLTIRIVADAPLDDLVVIEKQRIMNNMRSIETKLENRVKKCSKDMIECTGLFTRKYLGRGKVQEVTGKILHLDGDKKYSSKSMKHYNKLGLTAIVKNVPESKQPYVVVDLLNRYSPDILVITRS